MTTINFPSGIGAGIGRGLYAGVQGGLEQYDKGNALARQSIFDALKLQMLMEELQAAKRKRDAQTALPGNIATIGSAVQRALQGMQAPVPTAKPMDDLSTLAGPTGAAMRPAGMPEPGPATEMVTPPDLRTPMQKSGLGLHPAALMADPAVAQATIGMQQAGMQPFGPSGLFSNVTDFAKSIAKENDQADAMKEYEDGIALLREAGTDTDLQLGAVGKMNSALIRMGKAPNTEQTWKMLDAKQERAALEADMPKVQAAILGVSDGDVTADDLANVYRLALGSKSAMVRQTMAPYFQRALERMGPAGQAWQQYYEDRKAHPEDTPDQTMLRIAQANPQGVQAMMQPDSHGRAMVPPDYQMWKDKELAAAKKREAQPTEASLASDAAAGDATAAKALGLLKRQKEKPTDARKAQLEVEILEARRDGAKALNEIRAKAGVKDETLTTATLALDRLQRAEKAIREDYDTPDEQKAVELEQIKRLTKGLLEEMDKIQQKKGLRKGDQERGADPLKNVTNKFGITLPGAK